MDLRQNLIDAIEANLKKNRWAYMKAPTGAGKTRMTFELAERFAGLKVYLSASSELVKQTQKEAKQRGLKQWFFATWQKAKNLTDMGLTGVALVVVDEIHVGGVGQGKSIKKSIENLNPDYVLYISATPEPVNQSIFGSQENISEITQQDAIEQGLILPVRINAVTNKNIFNLGMREQEIADELEFTLDRLHEMTSDELGKYSEEIKEIRKIRRQILLSAALKRESQFVYYAENLDEADRTKDFLENKKITSCMVAGKFSKQENDEAITNFVQGKVSVLIACRMLREGWNMPQLEAVVDAAFSPTALHHVKQKAGRTSRLFQSKKEGRYYYCLLGHTRRRKSRINKIELIDKEDDYIKSRAIIDSILLSGKKSTPDVEVKKDEMILSYFLNQGKPCDIDLEIHETHGSAVGALTLLRLAKAGANKPSNRSSFGSLLKTIRSNPNNITHQKLLKIRPEWLKIEPKSEVRAQERWFELIEKFNQRELTTKDIQYLRNIYGNKKTKSPNFLGFMGEHCPEILTFIKDRRGIAINKSATLFLSVKTKLINNQPLNDAEKKAIRGWRNKNTKIWKKLLELDLVKPTSNR